MSYKKFIRIFIILCNIMKHISLKYNSRTDFTLEFRFESLDVRIYYCNLIKMLFLKYLIYRILINYMQTHIYIA